MLVKPYPWENKEKILITAHAFVDPDALGSILTMGAFLKSNGKEVVLLAKGGLPKNLQFLLGEQQVVSDLDVPLTAFDLVIIFDCGDLALTQIAGIEKVRERILNIDHHHDNANFGQYNWVDISYSSTTQMIYEFLKGSGADITGVMATSILAGLMGDTGSFRHANTNAQTMRVAGEILLKGARRSAVAHNLFAGKTPGQLKAWSYVLEKATFDKNSRAIISALTHDDIKELGVDDEAYEGIVEILNTFPEASFAAFVRQRNGEVKFSLRSEEYKGVDVSALARKFGGGGHKLSAGFTIQGRLKRDNGNIYIEPLGSLNSKLQSPTSK